MAIAAIMVCVCFSACSDDDDPVVTSISLSQTSLTLTQGETGTLTVNHTPAELDAPAYTWSSSNTAVVTVSNGVITAVGEGTATITVTVENLNLSASCTVTVNPIVPASIAISETSLSLFVGDNAQLTATVSPSDAKDKSFTWSSSDPNVATIDADGNVSAIAQGTATITATTTVGGLTATCSVVVKKIHVESVSLDKTSLNMIIGQTETLAATVSPENTTNKNITWKSSNETIAVVSDGTVTALRAGEVTITATSDDSGKLAYCTVTVKSNTDVDFNPYGDEKQW